MENLLTLYDNFLLSLQNMNTNILVEYLNNYDIFNQLVLLRNNEENQQQFSSLLIKLTKKITNIIDEINYFII